MTFEAGGLAAYGVVLIAGLFAGTLGGVVGTGSSIVLLPILVFQFGAKQAVPIMAIAAVMSNGARVVAWWREINWRACFAYALPAIPAAALGARTLLALPPAVIDGALGAFFLLMIPGRHWLAARNYTLGFPQLALCGGVIGYLKGVVVSTGPLSIPAFASFGLFKGALISTEAAASLAAYLSKVLTFRTLGALPAELVMHGLIVGSSLMAGAFVGKAIVQRMSTQTFQHALDVIMAISGCALMWSALV